MIKPMVRPLRTTERLITNKKKSIQTSKDKKPDIKDDEIKSDISSDSELTEADQTEISTIDTTVNKLLGPVIDRSCASNDDNDMVQ